METLKILMVADHFFPDEIGGSKKYIFEISQRLARLGYEVDVITKKIVKRLPYEEIIDGINVHRYDIYTRNVPLFHGSCFFGAYKKFKELKKDFDLINFHHPLSAFGVSLSRPKIPKVYTFYSPWFREYAIEVAPGEEASSLKKKLIGINILERRFIEGHAIKNCEKIITLSEYTKDQVTNNYDFPRSRIKVIPGGVDTARFRPLKKENRNELRKKFGLSEEKMILLTVRRLVRRMGLENLVRAISKIKKEFKNFVLIIGGTGHLETKLKRLSENLNLGEYIKFVGQINEDDLPKYYQISDLFILPTELLEGFGLVTLEALSSGVPVLGTPIGATKEILGNLNDDFLMKGTDSQAIANSVMHFLHSFDETDKIRKTCRDYAVKNYSWDKVISEIDKEYRNLL